MYSSLAPAAGLSGIGDNVDDAVSYLRSQWQRFADLSPRIIDAQHRAAVAAYNATQAGDTEAAAQARATLDSLAALQRHHHKALETMETVRDYVGLGSYRGLGAIPAIQLTIITGLALTVAWFFRAYAAEERKLQMIEAGTLTPEQAVQLSAGVGAAPGTIFGNVQSVAKYALWAALAFVALQAVQTAGAFAPKRGRSRRNPPLVVFDSNPPDEDAEVFGEEVYGITYRHADDGGNWFHEFGPGVQMAAYPDGSVGLSHRGGRRVWEEF